jgi:hypothetical protein
MVRGSKIPNKEYNTLSFLLYFTRFIEILKGSSTKGRITSCCTYITEKDSAGSYCICWLNS